MTRPEKPTYEWGGTEIAEYTYTRQREDYEEFEAELSERDTDWIGETFIGALTIFASILVIGVSAYIGAHLVGMLP